MARIDKAKLQRVRLDYDRFCCAMRDPTMELRVMAIGFDLDAYFERIQYSGDLTPSLNALQVIQVQHAETISFENLNPLLRWPVPLDALSLQEKMVRGRRGGWCFEQNLLLSHALQAMGFRVKGLAARTLWYAADDVVPARDHMLLSVEIDEETYVVDVGCGALTLTAPLRLETNTSQVTPHGQFRLIDEEGGEFVVQAQRNGSWKKLYRFGLEEHFLSDYEIVNWYLANHPGSQFLRQLIAARPATDCRYTLRNNELAVHHLRGGTERRVLEGPSELRATLEQVFGLILPDSPELNAMLERLAGRTSTNRHSSTKTP